MFSDGFGTQKSQVRILSSRPEKPTSFDLSVFQLNPPLRVGEIIFDDEILPLGRMKSPQRWVDLISSTIVDFICKADFILATARISFFFVRVRSLTPNCENIYLVAHSQKETTIFLRKLSFLFGLFTYHSVAASPITYLQMFVL